MTAIDRKLRALLESEGVSQIDASPGTPFDPREHEAIASVPGTDRADGEIVEEVRRGYGSATGSSGRRWSPSPLRRTGPRQAMGPRTPLPTRNKLN